MGKILIKELTNVFASA